MFVRLGVRLLYSLFLSLPLSPRLSVSRSLLLVFRSLLFFFLFHVSSRLFLFLSLFWSLSRRFCCRLLVRLFGRLLGLLFLFRLFPLFFFFSFFVLSFLLATPISLFLFSCLSSFSSVTGCLTLVVSLCRLWLGLRLCLCSSHPLSSFSILLILLSLRRTGCWGCGFGFGGVGGFRWCVFTECFLSSSGARDSLVVVRSFGFSRY